MKRKVNKVFFFRPKDCFHRFIRKLLGALRGLFQNIPPARRGSGKRRRRLKRGEDFPLLVLLHKISLHSALAFDFHFYGFGVGEGVFGEGHGVLGNVDL